MDTHITLLITLLVLSSGCLCGIIPESKPTTTTITSTTTPSTTTLTPTENTTTTTIETTTTTTSTTTTTTFKGQGISLTDPKKKTLLNMRWRNPTSACAQYGYNVAKADYLSELGLKDKYNDGVIYETGGTIIEPNTYNLTEEAYCFLKDNGYHHSMKGKGFYLNASLWNWTRINNTWTIWNITENYTDYWVETNTSDNLWIQER